MEIPIITQNKRIFKSEVYSGKEYRDIVDGYGDIKLTYTVHKNPFVSFKFGRNKCMCFVLCNYLNIWQNCINNTNDNEKTVDKWSPLEQMGINL